MCFHLKNLLTEKANCIDEEDSQKYLFLFFNRFADPMATFTGISVN